jgi:mRNA guanylyltransferase
LGAFPAPLPVPVTKDAISTLVEKRYEYLVSEKADGVRCLLYFCRMKGCKIVYLIDRRFDFYIVNGNSFEFLSRDSHLFEGAGTLLDGELVCPQENMHQYMMFDVLLLSGVDKRAVGLVDRLKAGMWALFPHFDRVCGNKTFSMSTKRIFRLTEWCSFLEHYKDVCRNHKSNDGIIFTPLNMSVHPGKHTTLFKWKPPSSQTIDFIFKPPNVLCVYDCGIERPVAHLLNTNNLRMLKDGCVIECKFDNNSGSWILEKERIDKYHGNNMKTYQSTMRIIKAPITFDILRLSLTNKTP